MNAASCENATAVASSLARTALPHHGARLSMRLRGAGLPSTPLLFQALRGRNASSVHSTVTAAAGRASRRAVAAAIIAMSVSSGFAAAAVLPRLRRRQGGAMLQRAAARRQHVRADDGDTARVARSHAWARLAASTVRDRVTRSL